ncbi:hypothetical protein [Tenacibaculum insulae]|uniref:hypothetical protein n=1 Tax=Tenacibaculum insulae TaxID=2029677 RepID=UPI003AB39B6C
MKDLLIEMPKVTNALLKIILILILFNIFSCKAKKNTLNDTKHYKIEKYKSKDYFTGINIKTYDNIDKKLLLPSTIIINNVYLKGTVFKLGVGNHKISAIYVSKKDFVINKLTIKPLDSIVIKTHLQDEMIID